MKKFSIFLVLFTLSLTTAFAQNKRHLETVRESRENNSVVVSLDTIYSSGEPWAVIRGKMSIVGTDLRVSPLKSDEVLLTINEADPTEQSFTYRIVETGDEALLRHSFSKNKAAEILVGSGIFEADGLNKEKTREFLENNRPPNRIFSWEKEEIDEQDEETETGEDVEDNLAEIRIGGGNIYIDGLEQGRIEGSKTLKNANYLMIYSVYHKEGGLCATAEVPVINPVYANIYTESDGKKRDVVVDDIQPDYSVVEFLVNNGYFPKD